MWQKIRVFILDIFRSMQQLQFFGVVEQNTYELLTNLKVHWVVV